MHYNSADTHQKLTHEIWLRIMGRKPCCEKKGLKKGKWTAEEDELLTKYIRSNGQGSWSWRSLPKNAGLLRCGKSCRLRWVNYLKDDLKRGNFTVEEEETIVKLHATMGTRWSSIATHLPGRTDNEIKNHWISHLSRKIYNFRSILHNLNITPKPASPFKSRPTPGSTKKNKAKKPLTESLASCNEQQETTESSELEPYQWLDVEIERLRNTLNSSNTQDEMMISSSTSNIEDDWLDWICHLDLNEIQYELQDLCCSI